jgi:2-polyprenyl-3-methyl-5-hydroxy-6-metoxy-1,4-benzoquinol methylase
MGFDMHGIDVSATRTRAAARMGGHVYDSIDGFSDSGGGPVHAVTLEQVREHLVDPLAILRQLVARMEPGGILFAAVPDCSGTDLPSDFESFHKLQPLEHVNAFTPASLRQLCINAGLQPVRRPPAFVTARPFQAARALGALIWQPRSTEQYFRLAP